MATPPARRLVKANDFKMNSIQKKEIDKEISETLKVIDEELKKSHRMGHGEVTIGLPLMFSIPNMPNITAQTKIYAAILMSLKERGFYPKFRIGENSCALHVSWVSQTEKQENQDMMKLIAEHTEPSSPSVPNHPQSGLSGPSGPSGSSESSNKI